MKNILFTSFLLSLVTLLLLPPAAVSAHGGVEVGDYILEIGFVNEPAIQGQPNGLELHVNHHETGEAVNGLENSLQVEVIYGASKKTLNLSAVSGEAGVYTAFLIPTEAGDYTFHLTGQIVDTPVDVTMTSSPETFTPVRPLNDVAFPGQAGAEAQSEVAAARQIATWALVAGVVGALLGLAGLVMAIANRPARRTEAERRTATGQ